MAPASICGHLITIVLMQAPPAAEPPRAIYTARELRRGLLATADKIKSLSVVYRSDDYDRKRYPEGAYLRREVTAKSPGSMHHVSAHGQAAMPWEDDPLQQAAWVTDRHLFLEFPMNRAYAEQDLEPNAGLPGTLPNDFFLLATGIWPLDGRPAPRPMDRPCMLRDVAKAEEFSVVRPRQERVDGRWCHVLESPGYESLWLDTERGFALLARETFIGKRHALVQRLEAGGHREAAPGIWLPRWMHNIQFDYEAPTEEGRQRRVIDARHEVLRAEVNRVDDGAFVFRPRAGSLLRSSGDSVQAQPGGLDHLDHLVRWLGVYVPASRPPARSASPIGAVSLLAAVLYIVACEVRRRRTARPPVASGGPL